jgi:hypothetical protein
MIDLPHVFELTIGLLSPFTEPSLGFWSPVIYWFVFVNAILCALFTLVVIVGGVFDLRFLFRALNEELLDETDDGRVIAPPAGGPEDEV